MESIDQKVTVSIIINTFNHEKFISQNLDGVVMQQVNFSYEVLIHDDASTDNTVKIIEEYITKYPHINFKPIFQKVNQYSQKIKIGPNFQYPRAQGKYIALCEGDDYWTDPLKLQKQVDFLEKNPEYVLSCHNYKILDFDGKTLRDSYEEYFVKDKIQIDIDEKMYLDHWLTKTLTVVLVNSPKIIEESQKINKKRDLSFFYTYIRNGKGVFHNFDGGIYRKQKGGVHSSNTAIQAEKETIEILEDLYSIYKTKALLDRIQIVKVRWIYSRYKSGAEKKIPFKEVMSLKISPLKKLFLIIVLFYNLCKNLLREN